MKKQIFFIFSTLLWIPTKSIGQPKTKHHALSFEVVPAALMVGLGSGLNLQHSYNFNSRLSSLSTVGFMYNSYTTGLERELFTSNGVPLAEWSTEVDIYTNRPYPLGGVVNMIDFENLDRLGFKQYKPKMGYRLNRYLSSELLYKVLNRKLQIYAGLGTMIGLTNRDDTHVGFTGTIENGFTGLKERFWININIRAKYMYLGSTAKLLFIYSVNDRLGLGFSSGIHYIFDKRFREDTKIPYIGITAKVGI